MDKNGIIKLCQHLNIDTKPEQNRTGYIIANCPLGPTRHLPHGYDSGYGFGISVGNSESRYRCFYCHASGNLQELVNRLREQAQMHPNDENFQEAMQLASAEGESVSLTITMEDATSTGVKPPPTLDTAMMQGFNKTLSQSAKTYLSERLVTEAEAEEFMLMDDVEKRRIVIPTFNRAGQLALLSGRSYDNSKLKYYFYKSEGTPHNSAVLYNENNANFDKPIVLVESYFDLYRVRAATGYKNIVAAINAYVSAPQQSLLKMAPHITTLFDSGQAGDNARWQIIKMGVPCTQLHPPPGGDGGSMSHDQIIQLFSNA